MSGKSLSDYVKKAMQVLCYISSNGITLLSKERIEIKQIIILHAGEVMVTLVHS